MLGASHTSLQRRASLKRKYEAYNQARSRLSQSQEAEPADKVPTTHISVPHFSELDQAPYEQKFLSVPNFAAVQFPTSPSPFTSTQSYFSTSAPTSTSPTFQPFQQIPNAHSIFPGQATPKTDLGKLPYSFTPPPVGFALQPELTNVTFNTPTTLSGFRFDSHQFHHPKFSSFYETPTTSTTTTTISATNPITINTPMSPPAPLSVIAAISTNTPAPPSAFFNSHSDGYTSLRTSAEDPSLPASQPPHNRVTFAPASLPQRREKEWVRTKDKSTIVVIGPCNLGKKFLVNLILSTTYETKRTPTLGRHRSDNNLLSSMSSLGSPGNISSNTSINTSNGPATSPGGGSNNVSISVTHNNVSSMFDFELIEPTPPVAIEAANSFQEVDFEFPLDSSFLNGINWEHERRTEMQEVYAVSQHCITKSHTISDERSFLIPQGVKRYSHTSQLFTISYDRIPQVIVTFLLESDLRMVLWQLHEHYEQGGKRNTLSPSRLDFLHHIYRMAIDVNPPLIGSTILSYLASSAELPLRASVRNMLGKVHRYIGAGRDAMIDRVYVREKINEVLSKYQYLIKSIEVKVPANVLHGGRKEIVILSDTTAHGHIRSSHIVQSINSADMVLLAVDNNGLTNELASLLVSSRFLTKLTKDPRKIMALDLSEGRVKSSLRLSIKDHLVAQLRRLYRDVDSASVRNSLPKILAEMEVLTLKPLLFASLELNNSVPPEYQDKVTLQDLKNSTSMPLLLERIGSLVPSEAKLPNRNSQPISPSISDSKPPISAEQLASSLKQRLHVTDGARAIPNTTMTTTTTTFSPPVSPTIMTTTSTTTSTTLATSTTSPYTPIPSPATPHAANPLLRSKFEHWQASMLYIMTSNECDYEFARRANECSKRAFSDWEQHFRDQFMSNTDNCSTILDPRYKGECLGVNISFLLFHDLTSWAPYFWRDSVLARVSALQSEMREFARRMLEAHAKAIDAKYSSPADSAIRMQQHTLLQYCQTTMDKSITTKFAALFEGLKIDVSSLISTICSELLHSRLLSRSVGMRGLKQYHKLITDAMHVLPYDVAGAIKAKFTEVMKLATQYLGPIEHHMDQLLNSLSASQNQLKNMDPTMRQYLQQRMFANMRFGDRPSVRPASAIVTSPLSKSVPSAPSANIIPDDVMLDVPNIPNAGNSLSASTNNTITFTPFPTRNNSFNNFTNISNSFTGQNFTPSHGPNSFTNTFNHNFHNNNISNKVNFSAVIQPTKRSSLPTPPQSAPTLTTLCVQAISKHINKIHQLQSGMLPEELVQRVIAYLISDEMSVHIKQLDSSILGKLLDDSLSILDFENATSLYPSSCMVIASRCTNLVKLNLTHCINIDDESIHHIASSLKHLEHLTMEGCYQVGDAGVVAIARGCPDLCTINLSGCIRITNISVHNLLAVKSNLQTLILRRCAEISDEAFQGISEQAGNRLLHVDLSECRNITDRTLNKFGQFCAQLKILTLSGKGITDEGLRSVVNGCAEIMELELVACDALTSVGVQQCSRLTQLRVFVLSTMRAITDVAFESDNMSDISDVPTKQWPNLQALTLFKCPSLSSKSVSFFAKNCSLLTSVDFSFYTQISDAAVLELAGACANLQDVDLSSCKDITDAAVVEVARKCSLRKLVVASCGNITDVSLFAVAQNPNLQHLDLTQCERISDEGVVKVAHGCPELKYISLAECNITDASILALGAAVDAQGSGCYHLETVRLAYCREIGDAALHKLARGCPSVHTLDLSNCSARITPEGLRVALRTWTQLQTLRLKGFHLSTESIIDGVHPSLKVLNLSWCRNIEDAVLVDIASACPALEHCDITRCTKITNDAVTKLAEKCSNLRQLNLTGCKDVTQGLVQMLVKIGKMIQR